jgi:hypothetical protein
MPSKFKHKQLDISIDKIHNPNQSHTDLYATPNLIADLRALNDLWNPPPNPYSTQPVRWVHHVAQSDTWSKQDEIYHSVNENRYTAVKSCHGPGKSFTAAHVVAWWLDTKPDPFAITSAPTSHQVRTILWREIRRAKKNAKMPGKISQGQVPEWKLNEELIAFGRKPADYLDPTTASAAFQGIHARSLLVVLDEGSGIPDWLANACETLITNEESRLLIIGNPDNPVSYFAKAFSPASDFHQITITAFDCPAFTGEEVSEDLASKLTSRLWVEERVKRWGKNSPMYKSKVLAEFPDVTDDTVFTPQLLSMCVTNDRSRQAVAAKRPRFGLDVARLGPDESVLYMNHDGYCRLKAIWFKQETMESVGTFRRKINPQGQPDNPKLAWTTVVDVNGLGAGVYDRLKELGYPVVPFNGGERAYNPLKYKNRRAEAYWEAREMMEAGLIDLEPEDHDLMAELMEIHFKDTSTGQKLIEPKEDIAQRLGHSPDRADAFVMSLQMQATLAVPNDNPVRQTTTTELPENIDPAPSQRDVPDDLVGDLIDMEF